ncbi:hypothetical protein EC844_11474 [Acinetobacter calcoaceticus]|uniref:Uncharacterized protein n=1 Tax=Acinetobacter calcoaceticus TaxID=471 RepID=A0A4V2R0S9_ACICA|nr:hypothetical protein EC844_11474 [Acinetobacter calcoaceticus]
MKKMLLLIGCLLGFSTAQAGLVELDNAALQAIEGQAGADLSLKLALNQKRDGTFDKTICSNPGYCHIALSLNNRFVKWQAGDTNDTWTQPDSVSGRKLWLVFKGMQGMINVQRLGLDGVDLKYKSKDGPEILKPSIQLSFSAASPIQIRNFGFEALSIEQDSFESTAAESNFEGDYGYLKAPKYSDSAQDYANFKSSNYDKGKETGFTGLMMNGNMALNGKVMIFSCDGSHPRC